MTGATQAERNTTFEHEAAEYFASLDADTRAAAFKGVNATVKLKAPVEDIDPPPTAAIHKALVDASENVWEADAARARVEIPGSCELLWKDQATHIFAPRESGKTTGLLVVCCNMAAAGTKVLYLDRENGAAALKEKLDDILAANPDWDAAKIRENLTPRSWPMFDEEWDAEVYGDAIETAGFDVVIYDSLRELFDQFGWNENVKPDWSKLWSRLGSPLVRRGVVPVFLDNTGHTNQHRAAGTGGKADTLQQGYRFRRINRFTRESVGALRIECTRSRLGQQGDHWQMRLGGGVYDLPVEAEKAPPTDEDKVLEAVTGDFQRATDLAESVGMSYKTFMRHVGHINEDEEHDADDEAFGEFIEPILIRGGKPTKDPVEVAIRADVEVGF